MRTNVQYNSMTITLNSQHQESKNNNIGIVQSSLYGKGYLEM